MEQTENEKDWAILARSYPNENVQTILLSQILEELKLIREMLEKTNPKGY